MLVPAIGLIGVVLDGGTIGTKCGLVRLPCPLFIALLLLIFTKIFGDGSCVLTYGIVGKLSTCFGS